MFKTLYIHYFRNWKTLKTKNKNGILQEGVYYFSYLLVNKVFFNSKRLPVLKNHPLNFCTLRELCSQKLLRSVTYLKSRSKSFFPFFESLINIWSMVLKQLYRNKT